ncbi:hypothetical protein CDD80_2920 [Ophiocordyceps camponoti-rufipedis]|uniref:Phosphatidylinositol-specific phospholipase C X domain-containing protein n=1 Tax=Ophiocordyceps camponoti-rufipedis TaxID=2004952 RepID=A0A2C5YPR0_9HYPO|nr:hypothetical protein CDD80_2920 [Ophiocordyceps camponoti-rufipedis]
MTALSIRNLSVHRVEVSSVERTAREGRDGFLRGVCGFFHGGNHKHHENSSTSSSSEDLTTVALPVAVLPFTAVETGVVVPEGGGVAIRLGVGEWRYEMLLRGRECRSVVLEGLSGQGEDEGGGDGESAVRLTVVYFPSAAVVAILSSASLESWMADVDDSWPLSVLSIPGTHNSPTCYRALPSVRCQAVGVPAQLRNGIRFLDIRVSANPNDATLTLVHSIWPISLTGSKHLRPLVQDLYRFLDSNPSETILVSIKREGRGQATDGEMARHLKRDYVDARPDRWWTHAEIPTLGLARGKLVLIRRFDTDDDMRSWAIDAHQWPDNCSDGAGGNGRFRIQDFYEVAHSQAVDSKIAFCHSQLERAAAEELFVGETTTTTMPPFFVNFLSASNFFNASCWPERIAAKVNPAAVEYLCVKHGEEGRGPQKLKVGAAGTGIVVTDWVGAHDDWDLVRCIVGMNARLQLGNKI